MSAAVELRSVRKSFGPVEVIRDISLQIDEGEFVVFVGPSGSGKSTLLRMIAGLETTTAGDVIIGDKNVTYADPSDRGIAMVFQSYALYPHMNVRDNIAFNLRLSKMNKAEIETRVSEAARILHLEELLERSPAQLSGGQRQRVAIGRAIVRKPKVFLFDEPLSNLDAGLRVQMRLEIERLHRELGTTMIYVTHDQVEAMTLADRILALEDGQVKQVGAPLDLYHNPANLFVGGFIGSPKMNLISGAISSDDASRFVADGGSTFDMGPRTGTPGAKVTLGVRPEALKVVAGEGAITARTVTVERLGNVTYAYLDAGLAELLTVQVPASEVIEEDAEISLTFEPADLHLFDEAGLIVS